MESVKISTDHEHYDDIKAEWIRNGRSWQFDVAGKAFLDYGGAVYRVSDVDAENPDFYQYASKGPTTWDENARGKVDKGWGFINEDGWYQELWQSKDGDYHTKYTPAPNEL